MPIGVATSVATPTMSTLPTIALARPPAEPGGGVVCMNIVGPSAPIPLPNRTTRIHSRKAKPNAMVVIDMNRLNRFTRRRRW